MLSKLGFAVGLSYLLYCVAEHYYNKGARDAAKVILEYAENHPEQTMKEFQESLED